MLIATAFAVSACGSAPTVASNPNALARGAAVKALNAGKLDSLPTGPVYIRMIRFAQETQVTLNSDGAEKTYSVGESFTETPSQTLQAFNRGTTELVTAASFLLPDGAQLTTNL